MRRGGPGLLIAAAALGGWLGCSNDSDGYGAGSGGSGGVIRSDAGASTGGTSGGISGGTGGSSASGGASGGSAGAGTGGSGAGGTGGSSGGTGGSSSGTGGSGGASDAGTSADANPGDAAPPSPCMVTLAPLAPQRFANLAATEGSRLRVGATASGFQVPAKPSFDWRVTFNGEVRATTVVGGDPAVVEFETKTIGLYQITVTVAGVTPTCTTTAMANAVAPNNLVALYRIRAIAPQGRNLAPLEEELPVSVGGMPRKSLELNPGLEVGFTARVEPPLSTELPAYLVQLRARKFTTRLEGFVDATVPDRRDTGFHARLNGQYQKYDLLVIPVPGTGAGNRAPRLYADLGPDEIPLQDYVMVPGTRVAGTISAAGVPLGGARVRLRDGLLPSTIGDSAASGGYELRVRPGPRAPGRFEARVLPPAGSGLPDAVLPASAGITIYEGASDVALDFQYAALATSQLDLTVAVPGGGPASKPVEVLVQSLEGELGGVGNFAFGGATVPGSGSFRQQLTTGAGATVSFARLPRARYRVTMAPAADLPGDSGITSEEVDLRTAGATVARTLVLKARTPVQGRLTGMAPIVGLRVRATDAGEDGFRRTTIVNVGSDGTYTIPADVDRLYRVSVEPTFDRTVPRIPLIPFRAGATAAANTQALPSILTVRGQTLNDGKPVPGVVVQIYCVGNAPDCVDKDSPDISNTPPVDETVSDAAGNYDLRLPEPN